MDMPPHRHGLERTVEVYSGHDELAGLTGSGYAIGADLVLTSADVVDPEAPCQVRAAWSERWVRAEEVWRGRGGTGAVLLRVVGSPPGEPSDETGSGSPWRDVPGIDHVRWARVAGGEGDGQYRLRCVARGFPRAAQRGGSRTAQTVSGLVDAPTGAVSKALTVGVLTPEPASMPVSLWEGLSGAALLAEPARQIVGVVVAGRDGDARRSLDVVPVTALLSDARFCELAGVPPGRLETVAEGDPSVILSNLLSPAREKLPPDSPDWRLLAPRHALVPFLGRDEELARLRDWAAEPGALSIAVLSGRSGTGRTRLAGELCEELARAGWDAGFLPLDSVCGPLSGDLGPLPGEGMAVAGPVVVGDLLDPEGAIDPVGAGEAAAGGWVSPEEQGPGPALGGTGRRVVLDAVRPTLLVVDHPEPSSPLVGELVRRLAKHEHNPPVRILLLVREPGDAEWWRRLDTAAGGWLRRLNTTTVQLNARPLTLAERSEHALAAMKAFGPSRAALPPPPPLDDPEYGLPLHVHLAVLMRLRDGGIDSASWTDARKGGAAAADARLGDGLGGRDRWAGVAGGLVGRFLAREYEQWAHVWPARHERVDDVTARQAVAVLTLTAPTPAELPGLLTAVPGLRLPDSPAEQAGQEDEGVSVEDGAGLHGPLLIVARWLGRIFPGEERLVPLGPDVLAERLLAETEGLDELVLALHDHEGRTPQHLVRMLDILRLSASSARVKSALRSLVVSRIDRLVTEAASAPASRLGDALNAALALFADDRRIGGAAVGLTVRPDAPLGLRALGVTLGELAVRHLRARGESIALAEALSVLSGRLAAVGRVGEAVVAAAEAVEIFAAAAPYEAAGARAEALYNLGACLLLAGEPGSALKPVQEAAARFRLLAEDEGHAGRADARADYNLACALVGVGRTDEAVGAFQAAGGDPDVVADLAAVLSVLSTAAPAAGAAAGAPAGARAGRPAPPTGPSPGRTTPSAGSGPGRTTASTGPRPGWTTPPSGPVTGDTAAPARPGPGWTTPPSGPATGDTAASAWSSSGSSAMPAEAGASGVTMPTGSGAGSAAVPGRAGAGDPAGPSGARRSRTGDAGGPTGPRTGRRGDAAAATGPGTGGSGAAAVPVAGPIGGPVGGPVVSDPPAVAAIIPEPLAPLDVLDASSLAELAASLIAAATTAVKGVAPTNRDLAHHLHLLASWLHDHGRTADARVPAGEAAARLRGLAGEEPGLRFMLTEAAGLLSRIHGALDDLDAAARSAAEAVRNLRALVALEPSEYRPALVERLLELGELLLLDDRPEEALDPLQEAMGLTAGRHAQARARRLLGLCLDELGRPVDAVAHLELAAELYDALTAEDPAYERHLTEVRARLGRTQPPPAPAGARHWMLSLVSGRPEEAVARAEQLLAECREAVEEALAPRPDEIHAYVSAQAVLARAWADAGRAAEGFALAMQASELLERHTGLRPRPHGAPLITQTAALRPRLAASAPDRPHAIAVGQVAAALGRTLVGLGRHEEAVPHLLTAIESHGQAGASPASGKELAGLLVLETVALSSSDCPADAESASDRLVRLYAALVSEGIESPVALAGALRLQGGIRFARQDAEGALKSANRALDVLASEQTKPQEGGQPENGRSAKDRRLITAACLELSGLALTELHEDEVARERLAEGTAKMAEYGTAPPGLADAHLLALVRLARLRAREDPAAGIALYARILKMRPLPAPDVLRTLIEELSAYVGDLPDGAEPGELLPPLRTFTDALERHVPVSTDAGLHDSYARCLSRLAAAAAQAGDPDSAVLAARLAVRVHLGLATLSSSYRGRLGAALAALAEYDPADLAVAEQAVALLSEEENGRELAAALGRYAAGLLERGRTVEALAHCERAADLCDELDDPAVAAATYAQLGAALAALDRTHAALEATTWSLAELNRARERGQELPQVRARAIQVKGQVLRSSGSKQEAMTHLVEALQIYTRLPKPAAAAEIAAMLADDLLASGRAEEAVEYAKIAATGHPERTVKHALALQRLARCHMMLNEMTEANELVERLIPLARRSPDDLTYRAILADSLAQSSELLPLLGLDDGTEAEARARESIAIYDDLMTTGMNAEALHTSRAGASLTLAAALRMRDLAVEAVGPLREAVGALERHAPSTGQLAGLLARAMLMLGDALMEAGRPLEAGLVFHRGTQVTRDMLSKALAHARLGFCQQELGRDDAADAALRVASVLLRELIADDDDESLAELLRDVLQGRLKLLEKAGRAAEARQIEEDLRNLRTR
ncbi:ATP-binding protein [Nonomuraea sp. SYSU D8015]|uniref:ATP-binding protein n=1 Tax=Nonomuraea sp. SYSU D8015 TaxID=2593644 RepID=UPI0016616966|nr:ATP-binding protein [Nonomuraea sp. SYSU D8015]